MNRKNPAPGAAAPGPAPAAVTAPAAGLDLLLMWHMHQPDYRDRSTGEFLMPWVYLHAAKDYSDMAWHLEQHPGMRAVVNFVPVLLDQIEDYCDQFALGVLRDPLLRLLARGEQTPLSADERRYAFDQCFRADHHRLIAPYPAYQRLYELFSAIQAQGHDSLMYLSDRYLYDLVTWYHLSWTGESVRRESEVIAQLMAKGVRFTHEDRTALLRDIADQVRSVIPRYRALAARGQIELSTTPHCHPLAPLMLDFRCARDALPEVQLPQSERYPGGQERVRFHVDSALASHERRFGAPPVGLWPAEGALSGEFAALLAARGIGWTASSEGVLGNSLRAAGAGAGAGLGAGVGAEGAGPPQHRPYRASAIAPGMLFFFRDDRLSDLIGFVYSKWHGRDAANNFVHELETIAARAAGGARPLVCVMLDGENAWEYYPYNGFFFLCDLYKQLGSHAAIRTVTGADIARAQAVVPPGAQAAVPQGAPGPDSAAGSQARATLSVAGDAAVTNVVPVTVAGGAAVGDAVAVAAPGELAALAAGSWVYGNLATWIGARDKNRAWDLLCEVKAKFDEAIAGNRLDEVRRGHALAQLADCEASDWFWWPGEENPGVSVSAFDALFRSKLSHLYRLLQLPAPEALDHPFGTVNTKKSDAVETGGTMRRGSAEPGV